MTNLQKLNQIKTLENLHLIDAETSVQNLKDLQKASINNENIFEHLMETTKTCSLGQITNALYEVGGQYRRNM